MHLIAHFSVYAILAICLGLGWKALKGAQIWVIVSLIGVLQEMTEIVTHHHRFELHDAILDSLSAVVGVLVLKVFKSAVEIPENKK